MERFFWLFLSFSFLPLSRLCHRSPALLSSVTVKAGPENELISTDFAIVRVVGVGVLVRVVVVDVIVFFFFPFASPPKSH